MADLSVTQVIPAVMEVTRKQLEVFGRTRQITEYTRIPETTQIPIENEIHWLKIKDVTCVFVDMKGSTQLSASVYDKSTAGAYQLFTQTAVEIFHAFQTPYVDVRGDGVFGLFNFDQVYRALATAISFKTFADLVFAEKMEEKFGVKVGCHIGIDRRTVLVRKVGLKRVDGRTDRQNEVWAGKPINMASKLAAAGDAGELLVSDRFYRKITADAARKSCGCPGGEKVSLWTEIDVSDDPKFDFDSAYKLKSRWCSEHGREFCTTMLTLDPKP